MDQKGTWRCQLNKGSCKKHTQRGGFADLRPESLSPSHSFIVSTATGPVAPILWARAITWRSIAACPRAGWVSMLLLEWLQKQCNHPAQGRTSWISFKMKMFVTKLKSSPVDLPPRAGWLSTLP